MSSLEEIPRMTDPLGQYWDQPCRSKILIDDKIALMEKRTFKELMAYNLSFPSGVYVGKMWSRSRSYGDDTSSSWLCWYGESSEPDSCSINTREIVFL